MVQEAKDHEAADKQAKDTIEKRNRLDGIIMEVEKTLKEHKDKLQEADVTATESALEKARTILKTDNASADDLQKATDELLQASHKVAEIAYKEKATQGSDESKKAQEGPIDTDIS
jgi:molecular chaperone DnaK